MKNDSPAPTLAGWLAQLSDEELSGILRNRPDTVLPLPPGTESLAARLQLRASIVRALRRQSALELAALEAAAALGAELHPVTAPEVVAELRAAVTGHGEIPAEEQIHGALDRLRAHALIFDTPTGLMIPAETMAALPGHWQLLPDRRNRTLSFSEARVAVDKLDPAHRKILGTLISSGGFGLTRDAAADADPTRPIPQLIAVGLLARVDATTVKLPAVVRRVLAGGEPLDWRVVPVEASAGTPAEDAGVAAGLEVVRQFRTLIDVLGQRPAATLKGGTLGVRALARLSRELALDETELNRLLALGVAAGLLARGVPDPLPADDDGGDYIAPTTRAGDWLDRDLAGQLGELLQGWWTQTGAPWLVGTPDDRGRTIHALSPESRLEELAETRRMLIGGLTRVAPAELGSDLFYHHPIAAHRISSATLGHLIAEATWIGAFAGGVTAGARALLAGTDPAGVITTPDPVDRFIIQADLTVMVPGPLEPELQRLLDQIAELESPGLASVYRISETSLRHALDLGLGATEIAGFLSSHALTEVPQSVTYLLNDVARRHGTLRGGPAMCYLRCDDPALLHSAVAATTSTALRLIAPGVAVSDSPLIQVITELRAAGFQPVAEDSLGVSLSIAPAPARVPSTAPPARLPGLDETRVQAAVAAIRRPGDAGASGSGESILAVLRAAVRGNRRVRLGFVDKQGVAVHRALKPVTVSAGQVDALDEATGAVQRFPLHRITEVIVD